MHFAWEKLLCKNARKLLPGKYFFKNIMKYLKRQIKLKKIHKSSDVNKEYLK